MNTGHHGRNRRNTYRMGGRSLWKSMYRLAHGTDAFSGRIAAWFRRMAVCTGSRRFFWGEYERSPLDSRAAEVYN